MTSAKDKALRFKALHQQEGAFIIPNPWDAGSARLLEGLGFQALATTSSGFAITLGRLDGQVTLEEKVEHCRSLCAVTEVPLSADLENGYADDPETAARSIARVAEVGVAGGSIEDYSGEAIYDFDLAVERIQAAAELVASLAVPFTLTARAENLIRGRNDLDDTIRRLQAFEAAGAEVLYAPGLKTLEEVETVTRAVSRPVNVLATMIPGVTVSELAAAGAKRLSIGGALAAASLAPLLRGAREMLERGSFGWTSEVAPSGELRRLLG